MLYSAGLAIVGVLFSWIFIVFSLISLVGIWIKYKFTKIEIIDNKLYLEEGVFFRTKKSIFVEKINNIDFEQNLLEKHFNTAHITLHSGNDSPIKIYFIENPEEFQYFINSNKKN